MISVALIVLFALLALAAFLWVVWSGKNLVADHRSGVTTMVSARCSLGVEVAAAVFLLILAVLGIKWAIARRRRIQDKARR